MSTCRWRQSGIGLIDFTVGIGIFFLFLSLFFSYLNLKTRTLDDTRRHNRVYQELVEQIELWKQKPLPKKLPWRGEFQPHTLSEAKGIVELRALEKQLVQIHVEIRWSEDGGGREWLTTVRLRAEKP